MFNLYEILRNAHGGHALDNLATQFGITAEEADAAVKARRVSKPSPKCCSRERHHPQARKAAH
jgi:hypothetical protein